MLFLPTQLADLQLDPFIFLLLLFLKPFSCSEFYLLAKKAIFNSLHLHKLTEPLIGIASQRLCNYINARRTCVYCIDSETLGHWSYVFSIISII